MSNATATAVDPKQVPPPPGHKSFTSRWNSRLAACIATVAAFQHVRLGRVYMMNGDVKRLPRFVFDFRRADPASSGAPRLSVSYAAFLGYGADVLRIEAKDMSHPELRKHATIGTAVIQPSDLILHPDYEHISIKQGDGSLLDIGYGMPIMRSGRIMLIARAAQPWDKATALMSASAFTPDGDTSEVLDNVALIQMHDPLDQSLQSHLRADMDRRHAQAEKDAVKAQLPKPAPTLAALNTLTDGDREGFKDLAARFNHAGECTKRAAVELGSALTALNMAENYGVPTQYAGARDEVHTQMKETCVRVMKFLNLSPEEYAQLLKRRDL